MQSILIGAGEVADALFLNHSWCYLGFQDIKQRYRRSILGPWWLTLSTGISVLILGMLWTAVFSVDVHTYMPFFATGVVIWTFISGFLTEACVGIIQFEGLVKQQKTNFFAFILRIFMRHTIILAHNLLIILIVIIFVGSGFSLASLNSIIGLIFLSFSMIFIGLPIAFLCARYRDMTPVITNLLQVIFYVTPIIWEPIRLGMYQPILKFNPFASLISIVRSPILGHSASLYEWISVFILILISVMVTFYTLGAFKKRVAYWL